MKPAEPPKPPTTDDAALAAERERLTKEVFEGFNRIAQSVGGDEVLRALRGSFLVSDNAAQRKEYDSVRMELDAYLRSKVDGEAAVTRPEGFVSSQSLGTESEAGESEDGED
ncbi:MAG: hypothetical protein JKY37_02215 [Nannocystaceae bacterium]|nr:hypothetical protein [Nannocystaceae bacterium]